jgi:transcriptional regulator with XRE-family HTH domain
MSNSVIDVLQRYLQHLKQEDKHGAVVTIAAEAKALGISAGTLSQLRNGKPITSRVIQKIAKKLASGEEYRRKEIEDSLEDARRSMSGISSRNALKDLKEFSDIKPGEKRLICIAYRDLPQSRDKGDYPGYVAWSADVIKRGLFCAMFQVFGPLEEIKERAKAAYDADDVEAVKTWNYIYELASGVHEVFGKMKKAVALDNEHHAKKSEGQIVLYELAKVPPLLACSVNARLFYSHQISTTSHEQGIIRITQLVMGMNKEEFIECQTESSFQSAVAAQFQPILQFWLNKGHLPVNENQLRPYREDKDLYFWKIPH